MEMFYKYKLKIFDKFVLLVIGAFLMLKATPLGVAFLFICYYLSAWLAAKRKKEKKQRKKQKALEAIPE